MLPDLNFYKVDRQSFLDYEPVSNRLSSFYIQYDVPADDYYTVANAYIMNSFHSLFEFVSDENSPSVTIDPETSKSFCSLVENKIQLGTIIFADKRFGQQKKVDAMFAVMLHEMWHKRYTNRSIGAQAQVEKEEYYNSQIVKTVVKKILPSKLHTDVLNILEDYRIEKLGLQEFPGYVFYFDALREYVLEFQSDKKFNISKIAGASVEYLMFKILLPEMLPWFIKKIQDCFASSKKTPQVTEEVLFKLFDKFDRYIKDNSHLVYSDNFNDLMKAVNEIVALFPKEVQNMVAESQYSSTHENYQFDNNGDKSEDSGYDDKIDNVKEELKKQAESIEKSKSDMNANSSDAEKVRVEKLAIVDANNAIYDEVHIYSPISGPPSPELLNEAKTISNHISRDLGFLASRLNQIQRNFELTEGELDEDELYSIKFSNTIFMEEEENPGFELDFGILIDESGSMSDKEKIQHATKAAAGIAMAALQSPHINLFVYGHSQGRFDNGHHGVELYEYINTKRRIRDWKNIFAAQGRGANADGYAIAKVGEIMLKDSQCRQKVLVVISDGYPMATRYSGPGAENHVRQITEFLENKGIEVIQLCIDNIERSKYMFKHFIPYDKNGNFGKTLREIMQKKLQVFMENY